MSYTAEHFESVSEIWVAYFAGKISGKRREELLKPYRDLLRERVALA